MISNLVFIQKLRLRTKIALVFLAIFLPAALILAINPFGTEAAWFNPHWGFRQRVNVTNNESTALSDFQVSITLDTATLITAGKMQSDCDDLRITNSGGKLLPHWIEENNPGCNDASTEIWVKVSNIPASGTNLYIYYGNPNASASQLGSGDKVFNFFDDFNGSFLDTNKWDEMNASNGSTTLNSGTATLNGSGDWWGTNDASYSLVNKTSIGSTYVAEAKINSFDLTGTHPRYFGLRSSSATNAKMYVLLGDADETHVTNVYRDSIGASAGWFGENTGQLIGTAPYLSKFVVNGNTVDAYHQGSITNSRTVAGWGLEHIGLTDIEPSSEGTVVDWVFARQFTANEPTTSLASEETGPGPVVWWKFDEGHGTTANDATSNNNDGTISGATWQPEDTCISGRCLQFDGSNDSVTRADDSDFDFAAADNFTITGWFRHPTIATNPDVLLAKFEATGADGGYKILMESDGDITFGIDDDNTSFPEDSVTSTTADYDDNAWHHFSAVKTGTTKIELYIDGVLIGTDSTIAATGTLANNDALYVGIDGDGSSNAWSGFIDDIKVFPFARTAAQIKSDFVNGAASAGSSAVLGASDQGFLSNGLVGYWKLDQSNWDGTTAEVTDSSGSGNHGVSGINDSGTSSGSNTSTTLNDTAKSWTTNAFADHRVTITGGSGSGQTRTVSSNTATVLTVSSAWTTTPDATSTYRITGTTTGGKFGSGGDFDGVDDYIDVTYPSTNFTSMSIGFWMNWGSKNGGQVLFNENHGDTVWFTLDRGAIGPDETLCIYLGDTSNKGYHCYNSTIPRSLWTHVMITYDSASSSLKMFLDGELDATATTTGTAIFDNFRLGKRELDGSEFYDGSLDEVRIYNRALSPAEVRGLYNWAPGPVGYWNFDEGSGSSAQDSSGNSRTGTLNNNATWDTGRFGKGVSLDGTDDSVSVGDF